MVIAQAFGGGRPDRVRSAIDSLYTAFIRSILPITAAALLLVHPLMTVLRVDPAAWAETRTYLLVVCAGLVGSIGYNLNAGILGGMGNSSTTLLFLAVSTILNIFLDLALVLAVPTGGAGCSAGHRHRPIMQLAVRYLVYQPQVPAAGHPSLQRDLRPQTVL